MSKLGVYVSHLLRYRANSLVLISGAPVLVRFPTGDKASAKSIEHAQLVAMMEEVALPEVLGQLAAGRNAFFSVEYDGHVVAVEIEPGPGAWRVTLSPFDEAANESPAETPAETATPESSAVQERPPSVHPSEAPEQPAAQDVPAATAAESDARDHDGESESANEHAHESAGDNAHEDVEEIDVLEAEEHEEQDHDHDEDAPTTAFKSESPPGPTSSMLPPPRESHVTLDGLAAMVASEPVERVSEPAPSLDELAAMALGTSPATHSHSHESDAHETHQAHETHEAHETERTHERDEPEETVTGHSPIEVPDEDVPMELAPAISFVPPPLHDAEAEMTRLPAADEVGFNRNGTRPTETGIPAVRPETATLPPAEQHEFARNTPRLTQLNLAVMVLAALEIPDDEPGSMAGSAHETPGMISGIEPVAATTSYMPPPNVETTMLPGFGTANDVANEAVPLEEGPVAAAASVAPPADAGAPSDENSVSIPPYEPMPVFDRHLETTMPHGAVPPSSPPVVREGFVPPSFPPGSTITTFPFNPSDVESTERFGTPVSVEDSGGLSDFPPPPAPSMFPPARQSDRVRVDESSERWADDGIDSAITRAAHAGAREVYVTSGQRVRIRVARKLRPLDGVSAPTAEDVHDWINASAPEEARERIANGETASWTHVAKGVRRFEAVAFRERHGHAIMLRAAQPVEPTVQSLGVPGPVLEMLAQPRGLLVVVTTDDRDAVMTALVLHAAAQRNDYILVADDDLLNSYESDRALVHQVPEVPYNAAIGRQADMVFVGPNRDRDSYGYVAPFQAKHERLVVLVHDGVSNATEALDFLRNEYHDELVADALLGLYTRTTVYDTTDEPLVLHDLLLPDEALTAALRSHEEIRLPPTPVTDRLVDLVRTGRITEAEAFTAAPDVEGLRSALLVD